MQRELLARARPYFDDVLRMRERQRQRESCAEMRFRTPLLAYSGSFGVESRRQAKAQLDSAVGQGRASNVFNCSIGKFVTDAGILGLLTICCVRTGERRTSIAAP